MKKRENVGIIRMGTKPITIMCSRCRYGTSWNFNSLPINCTLAQIYNMCSKLIQTNMRPKEIGHILLHTHTHKTKT